MGLPPEDGSSFEFISFRAILVLSRPPAPVHSLILTPDICRLGMEVFLGLRGLFWVLATPERLLLWL